MWVALLAWGRPEHLREGSCAGPHNVLEVCFVDLFRPEGRLTCRQLDTGLESSMKEGKGETYRPVRGVFALPLHSHKGRSWSERWHDMRGSDLRMNLRPRFVRITPAVPAFFHPYPPAQTAIEVKVI